MVKSKRKLYVCTGCKEITMELEDPPFCCRECRLESAQIERKHRAK